MRERPMTNTDFLTDPVVTETNKYLSICTAKKLCTNNFCACVHARVRTRVHV